MILYSLIHLITHTINAIIAANLPSVVTPSPPIHLPCHHSNNINTNNDPSTILRGLLYHRLLEGGDSFAELLQKDLPNLINAVNLLIGGYNLSSNPLDDNYLSTLVDI